MTKQAFLFFLIFISGVTLAQTWELYRNDTINRTDENGRKQGRWLLLGKHKQGTCYQVDQKIEEGKYRDNKKTDIWIEYYCNGNVKNKLTFVNGKADGHALLYHENGKISEEGTWRNSRWIGNYKLYYDNGQVQHQFIFTESGKREGLQKYYFENGELAIEGNFVDGKESGVIKEYYENGDLRAEKNYQEGNIDAASIKEYQPKKPVAKKSDVPEEKLPVVKVAADEQPNEASKKGKGQSVLNGQYILYNKSKQITKDGIFKDNRFMEGKAYLYNENGILTRVAVYRNGIYVGDAQIEN